MRVRHLAITPAATWESIRRELDAWARDVRAVLNGGLRLRDQVRVVLDVVLDTGALPVTVALPPSTQPIAVLILRAELQRSADGAVISGAAVTWARVAGGVRIDAVDGLAASTRYDVTLAVVE